MQNVQVVHLQPRPAQVVPHLSYSRETPVLLAATLVFTTTPIAVWDAVFPAKAVQTMTSHV